MHSEIKNCAWRPPAAPRCGLSLRGPATRGAAARRRSASAALGLAVAYTNHTIIDMAQPQEAGRRHFTKLGDQQLDSCDPALDAALDAAEQQLHPAAQVQPMSQPPRPSAQIAGHGLCLLPPKTRRLALLQLSAAVLLGLAVGGCLRWGRPPASPPTAASAALRADGTHEWEPPPPPPLPTPHEHITSTTLRRLNGQFLSSEGLVVRVLYSWPEGQDEGRVDQLAHELGSVRTVSASVLRHDVPIVLSLPADSPRQIGLVVRPRRRGCAYPRDANTDDIHHSTSDDSPGWLQCPEFANRSAADGAEAYVQTRHARFREMCGRSYGGKAARRARQQCCRCGTVTTSASSPFHGGVKLQPLLTSSPFSRSLDWNATLRLQRAMALDEDACLVEKEFGLLHNEVRT